jgi:hypothetical protein
MQTCFIMLFIYRVCTTKREMYKNSARYLDSESTISLVDDSKAGRIVTEFHLWSI